MDEKYYFEMKEFLRRKGIKVKFTNDTKEIKQAKDMFGVLKPSEPIIIK